MNTDKLHKEYNQSASKRLQFTTLPALKIATIDFLQFLHKY